MKKYYKLHQDNDTHWYLIPEDKETEWAAWLDIPWDDPKSWDVPIFAIAVDGPRAVRIIDFDIK